MSEHNLTRNQNLVLDVLADAEAPLSAYSILDHLRADGIRAPLQVYRALDKLQQLGLCHKLESINAFVACAHEHAHEKGALTAFAICEKCGRVDEFADPVVAERLAAWAHHTGFATDHATIEIRGRCKDCMSAS